MSSTIGGSSRKATAKTRTRAQTAPLTPRQSLLEDPELVQMRESFGSKSDLSSYDTTAVQRLLCHVKEYEQKNAEEENYQEAKAARQKAELIMAYLSGSREAKEREMEEQKQDTIRSLKKSFAETQKKFDEETATKQQAIIAKQKIEIEEFENNWSNVMPNKYRKPSQKLLQLKTMERTLASGGDYDRAMEIKKEVNDLMQAEQIKAQEKLFNDYNAARQQLDQTHQKQMHRFIYMRSQEKQFILKQQNIEISRILRHESVSTIKKKENNVISQRVLPPRGFVYTQPTRMSNTTAGTILPPLLTPIEMKQSHYNPRSTTSFGKRELHSRRPHSQPNELAMTTDKTQKTFVTSAESNENQQ